MTWKDLPIPPTEPLAWEDLPERYRRDRWPDGRPLSGAFEPSNHSADPMRAFIVASRVIYWLGRPLIVAIAAVWQRWGQPRVASLKVADQTARLLNEQQAYPGLSDKHLVGGIVTVLFTAVVAPLIGFPVDLDVSHIHYGVVQIIEAATLGVAGLFALAVLHAAVKLRQRRKDLLRRIGREPWSVRWLTLTFFSVLLLAYLWVPQILTHAV